MKAVEVKNLTFSYDQEKNAADNVTFSVEKGSYTTIIGHNGSGKSTVAKLVAGLLEKKSGICFDYAALMTGMLRSQGVPCKLVVGYAGTVYHAWISVWTAEHG